VYSAPVNIDTNTTLQAIAYKTGMSDSAVTSGVYIITALPNPWAGQDIGTVGLAGSASYSNGTYAIQGAGAGIAGTADAMQYEYQLSSGDCDIKGRVVSVSNTSASAKVGVTIRDTLNANAMEAGVWMTPSNGIVFTYRTSTGGATTSTNTTAGETAPYWVRLTRETNAFSAYYGTNGLSWTQLGFPVTIGMSINAYLGLGVSSGDTNNLCPGVMDNVTVTP